jgi:hypothetical protein
VGDIRARPKRQDKWDRDSDPKPLASPSVEQQPTIAKEPVNITSTARTEIDRRVGCDRYEANSEATSTVRKSSERTENLRRPAMPSV